MKRCLHIFMIVVTLVCFFLTYIFNISGLVIFLIIGISSGFTGYLFAKKSESFR